MQAASDRAKPWPAAGDRLSWPLVDPGSAGVAVEVYHLAS